MTDRELLNAWIEVGETAKRAQLALPMPRPRLYNVGDFSKLLLAPGETVVVTSHIVGGHTTQLVNIEWSER